MSKITSIKDIKYNQKLELWSARVAQYHASSLTVRQWYAENNVSVASLYKWQKIILTQFNEAGQDLVTEPSFVEIVPIASSEPTSEAALLLIARLLLKLQPSLATRLLLRLQPLLATRLLRMVA